MANPMIFCGHFKFSYIPLYLETHHACDVMDEFLHEGKISFDCISRGFHAIPIPTVAANWKNYVTLVHWPKKVKFVTWKST